AAREDDAVEPVDERVEELALGEERDVDREPALAVDSFRIGLAEVEELLPPVITHRDADQWPPVHGDESYTTSGRTSPAWEARDGDKRHDATTQRRHVFLASLRRGVLPRRVR